MVVVVGTTNDPYGYGPARLPLQSTALCCAENIFSFPFTPHSPSPITSIVGAGVVVGEAAVVVGEAAVVVGGAAVVVGAGVVVGGA